MDDPLNDIEFDTSIPMQPEGSWESENNNEKLWVGFILKTPVKVTKQS